MNALFVHIKKKLGETHCMGERECAHNILFELRPTGGRFA